MNKITVVGVISRDGKMVLIIFSKPVQKIETTY